MSIEIMSRVWKYADSSLGELLVFLALADHANDNGFCWPGVEGLAKKSRLSERQTRYILRNLESKGYIKTLMQQGPRGCNMYEITIGEGGKNCPPAVHDTEGGSLRQNGGQPIAPESSGTVIEPPIGFGAGLICPCLESNPKARELWHGWVEHRMKLKKPTRIWAEFFAKQANWLKQYDPETIVSILEKSLINGYTGLFEPSKTYGSKTTGRNTQSNPRNEGTCATTTDWSTAPQRAAARMEQKMAEARQRESSSADKPGMDDNPVLPGL